MENYRKGKNVEDELDSKKIQISDLPEKFLWMQVRGGTKIRNVLSYALEHFVETECVVWTGFGPSVGKAITCANIMKNKCNNQLHQVTKICFRTVEEYWDPIRPELDQLVVRRNLPMIHIMLTKEPFNTNELGYQPPNFKVPYGRPGKINNRQQNRNNRSAKNRGNGQKKEKQSDQNGNSTLKLEINALDGMSTYYNG